MLHLLIVIIALISTSTSRVKNSCKEQGLEKREIKKALQRHTNLKLIYERQLRHIAEKRRAVGLDVKIVREKHAILSSFYGDNNQLVRRVGKDWKIHLAKLNVSRAYFGCSCGRTKYKRIKIFCIFSGTRVIRQTVRARRS